MNRITRHAAAILLLLITLTATAPGQQKRQTPPKTPPKPAAATAPTPAPTFETLLPADSYAIYVEVRGAGQLVRSNTITDLLEPILKLAGPPKEFKSIVKWLNAHSEQLLNSRLLVATWPMNKTVPETIVAIEFASPEEATKFVAPLNEFLPTVLPAPEPSPKPKNETTKAGTAESAAPAAPAFNLQRLGALVLIAQKPWTMKQLKPAGSKLLAEDVNFRTIRNRFNSEPVFAFIDIKALERQDEERMKQAEETRRLEEEQAKREQTAAAQERKKQEKSDPEMTPEQEAAEAEAIAKLQPSNTGEAAKEMPTSDPVTTALSSIGSSFFGGPSDWPDAIGVALSFEDESFDLRALFVNAPGEKSDAVPFMPNLITGPMIAPETPAIFPADTELLVTMSLDLPQIYTALSKRPAVEFAAASRGPMLTSHKEESESPFAEIEKRLKINLKDELLPLLGSEVAIRFPTTGMGMIGISGMIVSSPDAKEDQSPSNAVAVAIAVRDKEALRALMPKLIDGLGFKGASSFAQTERREDTELVSYPNMFSYAFVGNFIVVSTDPNATRQIIDSYLKHDTLASTSHFKNFTRWEPRQLHGQVYISPALMESLKNWTASTQINDQTRAFFTRLNMVSQPITYALSNEGFGPLHELHLPKNLVMMAVAGISGESNPPPMVQNERTAISALYTIVSAEQQYRASKGNGVYGPLEELIDAGLIPKGMIEKSNYKFELTINGDKFEVTAVPSEYGKSGTLSFFIDQTFALRGANHAGAPASASDPPIR